MSLGYCTVANFALAAAFVVPGVLALRMSGKWLMRKGTDMERRRGREAQHKDSPDNPFGH